MTYDEARGKIVQALRAHARSQDHLFRACYSCRDAMFPPGESDVTLFAECVAELNMKRSLIEHYEDWRRVQVTPSIDAQAVKRARTPVVARVGAVVKNRKDYNHALEVLAAEKVTDPKRVRETLEKHEIKTLPAPKKAVTAQAVKSFLRHVVAAIKTETPDELVARIRAWAKAHGIEL